jgi:o-succinylbenzoate---CoA ligase
MTEIRCPLYESSLISKHEPALVSGEGKLLYHELNGLVTVAAERLRAAGCREGDRIAFYLGPDWRYIVLLLATLRIGAVACPLNTRLPRQGVRRLLELVACRKIVAVGGEGLADEIPGLEILVPADLVTLGALPEDSGAWKVDLDRPATIVFTSGSSGEPKAVLLTHGNHYYSARGSNLNIALRSHDRWLLSLPLYHVGGLGIIFRCVLAGAAIALPEPGETLAAAQDRLEPTHVSLVGTQLGRLLRESDPLPASFAKLKAVLVGGGAVSETLLRQACERHLPVFNSYGLTEMCSQVATMAPESPPSKRCATSGRVLKHRELRLAEDGEILVRGQTLCGGYVDRSEVVLPVDGDGWFATGDLGRVDEQGYLTVAGRKDHMFISGGENIHPEEIESALSGLKGVEQAVVVPVDDEEFGARPVAYVKMARGSLEPEALAAGLEPFLPRYKIPIAFLEWPKGEKVGLKANRERFRELARRQCSPGR